MSELLLLLGAALVLAFTVHNLRAREQAMRHCRRACTQAGVQLLDDTVTLERIRPARDALGRACWRRTYAFEYTVEGTERRSGLMVLRGTQLELLRIDAPEDRPLT